MTTREYVDRGKVVDEVRPDASGWTRVGRRDRLTGRRTWNCRKQLARYQVAPVGGLSCSVRCDNFPAKLMQLAKTDFPAVKRSTNLVFRMQVVRIEADTWENHLHSPALLPALPQLIGEPHIDRRSVFACNPAPYRKGLITVAGVDFAAGICWLWIAHRLDLLAERSVVGHFEESQPVCLLCKPTHHQACGLPRT